MRLQGSRTIFTILLKPKRLVVVECDLEVVDLTTATTHIALRVGKIDGGAGVGIRATRYAPIVYVHLRRRYTRSS